MSFRSTPIIMASRSSSRSLSSLSTNEGRKPQPHGNDFVSHDQPNGNGNNINNNKHIIVERCCTQSHPQPHTLPLSPQHVFDYYPSGYNHCHRRQPQLKCVPIGPAVPSVYRPPSLPTNDIPTPRMPASLPPHPLHPLHPLTLPPRVPLPMSDPLPSLTPHNYPIFVPSSATVVSSVSTVHDSFVIQKSTTPIFKNNSSKPLRVSMVVQIEIGSFSSASVSINPNPCSDNYLADSSLSVRPPSLPASLPSLSVPVPVPVSVPVPVLTQLQSQFQHRPTVNDNVVKNSKKRFRSDPNCTPAVLVTIVEIEQTCPKKSV